MSRGRSRGRGRVGSGLRLGVGPRSRGVRGGSPPPPPLPPLPRPLAFAPPSAPPFPAGRFFEALPRLQDLLHALAAETRIVVAVVAPVLVPRDRVQRVRAVEHGVVRSDDAREVPRIRRPHREVEAERHDEEERPGREAAPLEVLVAVPGPERRPRRREHEGQEHGDRAKVHQRVEHLLAAQHVHARDAPGLPLRLSPCPSAPPRACAPLGLARAPAGGRHPCASRERFRFI